MLELVAVLIAVLASLGLNWLIRRPKPEPEPTKPDTTIQELDDAIAADVAEATPPRPDPRDFPDDDPAAVAELGKWTDDL